MQRSVVYALLAALVFGSPLVSVAAPIPTEPIHTNKRKFRIPFRFDAAELQRLQAREIRLYVSHDFGKNWRLGRTVAPNTGRFDFEVLGDGEFWFSVRTVDRQGGLHPRTQGLTPGLKVVVDTTSPLLNIALEEKAPGRVAVHWSAGDRYLQIDSLRVQFIRRGDLDWQDVRVAERANGTELLTLESGGLVAVRGVVVDAAGNQANGQAQLNVTPAEESVPAPRLPEIRVPIAEDQSLPAAFPNQPGFPQPRFAEPREPSTANRPLPLDSAGTQPSAPQAAPRSAADFRNLPQPVPNDRGNAPRGLMISDPYSSHQTTVPRATPPPFRSQPAVVSSVMPTGRYRAVNSRKFDIEYRLDDVGPSGVDLVEMYITQDDGRQWYRYGTDHDRKSPFAIQVPEDGVYGFSLRVRSGAGVLEPPPQPGDRPDILTLVDGTPPKVEMLPLQQGQGDARHKIRIRWSAEDTNLSEKPIAIYYAADRQGPWEPITGWMENRSVYIWNIGPDVPDQIYVRLAARDIAGNVTRIETPRPVVIDLSRPSARIVDIESATRPQR